MIVACGNDHLYTVLCHLVGCEDLATDARFATNAQRVRNRHLLIPLLQEIFQEKDTEQWLSLLHEAGIPCGPIHSVSTVFHDPQLQARGFVWECEHPTAGKIALVGSPINLSETPPRLYEAPPLLGEDNALLLNEGVSFEREEVPCLETRRGSCRTTARRAWHQLLARDRTKKDCDSTAPA